MAAPRDPAELKLAFLSTLTVEQKADPFVLAAIDELIEKIILVWCGEAEFTAVELLFGRSLIQAWEEQEAIWND